MQLPQPYYWSKETDRQHMSLSASNVLYEDIHLACVEDHSTRYVCTSEWELRHMQRYVSTYRVHPMCA